MRTAREGYSRPADACSCLSNGTSQVITEVLRSERQLTDQPLLDSEEKYKRLLASVTDYVYTVMVDRGRPVATAHGPGCEAVTGYAPAEFYADPFLWCRMIHEEDRPTVLAQAERVLRGETPPPLEHRIIHKNGSIRWIRNTQVPRNDSEGRPVSYDGLVSDITARKQAEIALQESQERLALVIQGSNDGIWDWDLKTNQVYFSPRWKSMLGYEELELGSDFSAWERLLHPDDRERALALIQAYLSGQIATYELEHRLRHKDGSYRWILARGRVLRDAAGKPVRMAGSHVDLTERKLAQEQLLRANVELTQSEETLKAMVAEIRFSHEELQATQLRLIQAAKLESVGTLAAGVAHEVKNPLHTILMGLDYLDRNLPGTNESIAPVLGDMREAVKRANTIIRDLLRLSAPADFQLRQEDLNAVVEHALWLINNETVASHVSVLRHLGGDLPRVVVDRQKIEQVLINLFINALQAMSQGGVLSVATRAGCLGEDLKLSQTAFPQFKCGDRLAVIEVQDSGPGIPEEDFPRLFDPFFTTKPVGVGAGLGLSVAKTIVEFHQGAIQIQNVPQGGALVTLVLRAEQENTL